MQKDDIFEIYKHSRLIRNLRKIENKSKEDLLCKFEGEIDILGDERTLVISIPNNFPISTPNYSLISEPNYLPHLTPGGQICYMQNEGVVWDIKNPKGVLLESLEKAIKTIEQGLKGENKEDFLNEFEFYWGTNENRLAASFLSYFELNDSVKRVNGFSFGNTFHFYDVKEDFLNFYHINHDFFKNKKQKKESAIYIPLQEKNGIIPPEKDGFWTREEINEKIFGNISKKNETKLREELKKNSGQSHSILIVMLPIGNGAKALFGIYYKNIKNRKYHPLISPKNYCVVHPFSLNRMDKELILPRGGANSSLTNKKVAIIGCGSLGGYIAPEIMKAGILNLSLIDNDVFSKDNIFRHYLGVKYLGQKKVDGLKKEIEQNIPYSNITTFTDSVENLIREKKINFKKYDLIIVATGAPTINMYLNEYFIKNFKRKPIIYTWIDPYGIGGHVLLTNNQDKEGCYQCIYRDNLQNIASFAAIDQKFTKSLSGCGSLFTPYGSADALQTAILSIRLAMNVLKGEEVDNPILSWKGDPSQFIKAGFKLSSRFEEQNYEELYENRYLYKNQNCPICSAKK